MNELVRNGIILVIFLTYLCYGFRRSMEVTSKDRLLTSSMQTDMVNEALIVTFFWPIVMIVEWCKKRKRLK